jgi:L-threonylcarbamoyladenylate synthase
MSIIREPTDEVIREAGELLRNGHLVAFPTETVYGLGANALDDSAVSRIFAAKGRPSDNPLIVHVADIDSAKKFVKSFDALSEQLANFFWPGPLTVILPVDPQSGIAKSVTAGLDTVGIRVPDHPVALSLLRAAKVPLAAPSANKSGSPSPTTAKHVYDDLSDSGPRIILDGGSCRVGLESTVVEVRKEDVFILRPGGITPEMISKKICLSMDRIHMAFKMVDKNEAPKAPGMKYRHYAPRATVVPVLNRDDWDLLDVHDEDVVIVFDTLEQQRGQRLSFGSGDVATASERLFDLLRRTDDMNSTRVYIDCSFDRLDGLGHALWNRISKAASGK